MPLLLNLPLRIYIVILSALTLIMYVFTKTIDPDYRSILIYISGMFSGSVLLSSLLIRMGKHELYKNILNALWNFEAACVFCYGIFLFYDYSLFGLKQPELIASWARDNNIKFISITCILFTVCILRAASSSAEVFKKSILKSKPLGK